MRLRKIIKSHIGNRINQAYELKKRNQRLIERFEKKELQFMEEFTTNSNYALNNFDNLDSSNFRFFAYDGHHNG